MRHAPPVAPLVMKFVDIALHLHLHAIHRYSKFSSQYMFDRWQFHQLVLSFLLFECWSFNRGAVPHWKLFGSSGQRLTWWALHTMRSTQQCGAVCSTRASTHTFLSDSSSPSLSSGSGRFSNFRNLLLYYLETQHCRINIETISCSFFHLHVFSRLLNFSGGLNWIWHISCDPLGQQGTDGILMNNQNQ